MSKEERRPILVSKEGKNARDMSSAYADLVVILLQKRPMLVSKEAYATVQRGLNLVVNSCQKREAHMGTW